MRARFLTRARLIVDFGDRSGGEGLARSRDAGHSNKRLYYIAVPVLALVLSAAVYFVVSQPAQSCQNTTPIMNYSVQISIQVAGTNSTGGRGIQFVVPKGAGEAGLMWNSHTYDAYGLDCKSPLYMDPLFKASHIQDILRFM